ncbi:Zn-dependent exopeptidase [Metschnikowia bicuspidata var. bicuspidata NRRL YB-4993]|uniref:Inactive metallocarboxypeptidase ECM14 n=1 Tax=Metschnikowia bicuspidata var. bicuspidata NRRL YB-4993 TaxID=869754 RepID=A0A1A0H6D6_9ASCO|nr:Zn-dependent exopeptidase [Metschnikowia bicuspidata var. bicuspidata NRRL YB-4993]OBA19591.1 Zn-dependent exopeptidase [Metschnikowia bicuspidata var. bicuspidata NRRL YB-4993]
MKVALLAYVFAVVASQQIPFFLDTSNELPLRPHYSSLDSSELPIDLSQYMDNVVVRVNQSANILHHIKSRGHKIWAQNSKAGTVDVQLHSNDAAAFFAEISVASPQVLIRDLPQAIFETFPDEMTVGNTEPIFAAQLTPGMLALEKLHVLSEVFFKQFRPLSSINAWLALLQQTYPDIITLETIGQTYEGRPLQVVHLLIPSDNTSHDEKRTIVVTGGVHAREWISVSSVLYGIYEILNHFESNPDNWRELAKLDFLFIPVLNPDGYEYSWSTDRLWRKNRQPAAGSEDSQCRGIDIDHSYDFHWTPSSDSICGEDYAGSHPFEAYELKVWDTYLNRTNEGHKIWGYIDLHSYSQEILIPYAYSCEHRPRDEENLIELAYGISKAIRLTSGKYYSVLPACIDRDSDLIPDMGAGTALDYMYHQKSYWAYQIKLRDNGSQGFLLPAKYIVPVGKEISAGLKVFCKFILSDD